MKIPDEAVAALVNSLYDKGLDVAWEDATEAIKALLVKWPGSYGVAVDPHDWRDTEWRLPLPKDDSND